MASLSSRNLGIRDRSFFFSTTTAGVALGTLLTGTLGSYTNETFGWPSVFYSIGFVALAWVAVLKYHAMELSRQKQKVVGMESAASLLATNNVSSASETDVPWLVYLRSRALW